MKQIGAKRGSNLLFCIMLIALLGVLGGGYALVLSYNTNSAVSQREFQQEYLAADSLRQSLVESVLEEQNPLLDEMHSLIDEKITAYLAFLEQYNEADDEEKEQLANDYGAPELWLMGINDMPLSYHGVSDLGNGVSAAVDTKYDVGDRILTIDVDYTGTETYKLSVRMKSNGTTEQGSGIHLSTATDYLSIPATAISAPQNPVKPNKVSAILGSLDGSQGDIYYQIQGTQGNCVIDVSKIALSGMGRVFLCIGNGIKVTLSGVMNSAYSDWASRLFIVSQMDNQGNDNTRITLADNLVFYGQIYMPDAQYIRTSASTAVVNGTVTVSSAKNSGSAPRITVNEIMGDYTDTGVTNLGGYWGGEVGTGPVDGSETVRKLADLTGWEVERYYEG